MCNVIQVANTADIIVNGYAFTKSGNHIRVLNLNKPDKAAFISRLGEVLETTMDDIELDIIQEYYKRNSKFIEE